MSSHAPLALQLPPARRRHRNLLHSVVLSIVVALSAAAAVFTAVTLTHTRTPVADTVVVVPPGPPTFSADEVAAAKQKACAAWNSAATAIAQANAGIANAPKNWDDPATQGAAALDARTTLVESAYLKREVGPATPPEISLPIHEYLVATFDQQDANVRRMGSQADAAVDRMNAAVDKADTACG